MSTAVATTVPKALHIGLWVVQGLLAAMFGMAGIVKTTTPIPELVSGMNMAWAGGVPEAMVRLAGVSEFVAAIGLILPAALRIKPALTGYAAVGLIVVMVLASGLHISRGEFSLLPVNAALGGLAIFVAWGRLVAAPIAEK